MSLLNKDSCISGIHRVKLIPDGEDVRVYIPGLSGINPFSDKGTLDKDIFNENKKSFPKAQWCAYNLESTDLNNQCEPMWAMFEGGDAKNPVIISYTVIGGSGSSSIIGGGTGKKVLIVPGHANDENGFTKDQIVETNYGTLKFPSDARGHECTHNRKTAQYMYDYIEKESPGLAELYPNINDYKRSLLIDIFNKTVNKGFFNKYQAIVEIHYNAGGNAMFMVDSKLTDDNVKTIGKEFMDELKTNGYPVSSYEYPTSGYTNGFLVDLRCSIEDGNQHFYYLETKDMGLDGTNVTETDYKKVGEALGKVICKHYKVISGGGLSAVASYALSLVDKDVTYSMENRTGNYDSDSPTSLDCSSFVFWCYYKAGLLSGTPYSTESFWTSSKFEQLAGPDKADCEKFINDGKLQEGDVLLRSTTNNFSSGGSSHALIVASGSYNGQSFKYVNCTTGSGTGKGHVKGTNTFFNSSNNYFGIMRYKGE